MQAQIMKEKAMGLPGTSRAQQSIAGKPSTQCENPDTTNPTIRPALVLSKDHYDTANGKDQTKKEATKDNQVPTTSPNKNLGPDLNINTLLIQNQTSVQPQTVDTASSCTRLAPWLPGTPLTRPPPEPPPATEEWITEPDFDVKTQAKATPCPDHGPFTILPLTRPSLWTSALSTPWMSPTLPRPPPEPPPCLLQNHQHHGSPSSRMMWTPTCH